MMRILGHQGRMVTIPVSCHSIVMDLTILQRMRLGGDAGNALLSLFYWDMIIYSTFILLQRMVFPSQELGKR